jgi:hypothetical protein
MVSIKQFPEVGLKTKNINPKLTNNEKDTYIICVLTLVYECVYAQWPNHSHSQTRGA